MTHKAGYTEDSRQRWIATPAAHVTKLIVEHRHNELTLRRFFDKVDFGFEADDCHLWTGALSSEGYGDFSIKHRTLRAHRVRWIWAHGEPPTGEPFLDHSTRCIGRFCLNLAHLEPVDNAENQRRRTNAGRINQRAIRSAELIMRDERRAAGEEGIF